MYHYIKYRVSVIQVVAYVYSFVRQRFVPLLKSSRVYPRIPTRRYTARREARLTNCLCLSPAIFSPGYCFAECDRPTVRTNERTDGVNEPRQRASISSQPVTLRPRSHGVYPPVPCCTRYPVPFVCPYGRPRHSAGHRVGPYGRRRHRGRPAMMHLVAMQRLVVVAAAAV